MIRPIFHFKLAPFIVAFAIFLVIFIYTSCTSTTMSPSSTKKGLWSADGIIKAGEYTSNIRYFDYQLFWSNDDQYAYFGIKVKTAGYVALGLQPGSTMKDADLILGFVKQGSVSIFDMYSAESFGPHFQDTELGGIYDIIDFGGSEGGGFTILEFKRALDTTDMYDIPLSEGTNKILWAYGAIDEFRQRHTARGYGEINISLE